MDCRGSGDRPPLSNFPRISTTSLEQDPMSRFFHVREIARPEDVIPHLAKQELHWRKGYSAYELALSWVTAGGIPASVRSVLDTCPDYAGAQLVEGLLEREVDLCTRGRPSQTDLLAFVKLASSRPTALA